MKTLRLMDNVVFSANLYLPVYKELRMTGLFHQGYRAGFYCRILFMTHQKPLVSVLLPVFNAATTLNEALDSLAGQTLDKFEVIVVDDGSTDSSVEILNRWGVKDKRFHIIHREHQGIVPTLNAGLEACRADLVARMDADDISHPQRLERQYRFMCSHPQVVLVACCVNTFSETGLEEGFRVYLEWQNSLLENEHIRREMFIESPFSHPSVMFRKHPVLEVGGYRENGMPEDYDLWLRLYIQGARFAKLPDILLEWRDSPTRLTRSDPRYSLENFSEAQSSLFNIGTLGRSPISIYLGRRNDGSQAEQTPDQGTCAIGRFC